MSVSLFLLRSGATKRESAITEAASYFFALAKTLSESESESASEFTSPLNEKPRLSPSPKTDLFTRTTTEDYALLDSYQNLLFSCSIARFRTITGHYPSKITVVGYAFKRRRYTELHARAIRWPRNYAYGFWKYVGIIDMENEEERAEAMTGEITNGYGPYLVDLYECHDTLLEIRRTRNVHWRTHPYRSVAPEIKFLLDWCPSLDESLDQSGKKSYTRLFTGPLPWDNHE